MSTQPPFDIYPAVAARVIHDVRLRLGWIPRDVDAGDAGDVIVWTRPFTSRADLQLLSGFAPDLELDEILQGLADAGYAVVLSRMANRGWKAETRDPDLAEVRHAERHGATPLDAVLLLAQCVLPHPLAPER